MGSIKFIKIFLVAILTTYLINCTSDRAGGTIETTNGAIAGIVIDTLNNPASSTIVKLIPSDFNPITDNSNLIYIDTSNSDGMYEFKNIKSGIYNIEFDFPQANFKAFKGSIESSDNLKNVDTVKLNLTGSLLIHNVPDSLSSSGNFFIEGSTYKWTKSNVSSNDTVILNNLPSNTLPAAKFQSLTNNVIYVTTEFNILEADTISIKAFDFFNHLETSLTTLKSNNISALSYDKMGFLWIGTADSGFAMYSNIGWQVGKIGNGSPTLSNKITCITSTNSNGDSISWIGTTKGIVKRTGRSLSNRIDKSHMLTISDNIKSITSDLLMGIWVGTDKDLTYFNGSIWTLQSHPLASKEINSCVTYSYNNVWIGNSSGIANYDGFTWKTISDKSTYLIYKNPNYGEMWFLHDDGTISISENGTSITKTLNPNMLFQSILQASDGTVYLGTNNGVILYTSNGFTTENPGNFIVLYGNSVTAICENSSQNIFFGTEDNGLILFGNSVSNISLPKAP